jgi:hypothetical protein
MKYFEEMTKKWKLNKQLSAEDPTDWPTMLAACGQIHKVSLADLRESLTPRQVVYQSEKPAKGTKKGGGKMREREWKNPKGKAKGTKGKKGKGRGKWSVTKRTTKEEWEKQWKVQPTKKKEDLPKERPPKNEIPCMFHKKGKCTKGDKCEYKH